MTTTKGLLHLITAPLEHTGWINALSLQLTEADMLVFAKSGVLWLSSLGEMPASVKLARDSQRVYALKADLTMFGLTPASDCQAIEDGALITLLKDYYPLINWTE